MKVLSCWQAPAHTVDSINENTAIAVIYVINDIQQVAGQHDAWAPSNPFRKKYNILGPRIILGQLLGAASTRHQQQLQLGFHLWLDTILVLTPTAAVPYPPTHTPACTPAHPSITSCPPAPVLIHRPHTLPSLTLHCHTHPSLLPSLTPRLSPTHLPACLHTLATHDTTVATSTP